MKTYYLFLLALLISATSIAQQGINYKALIKDANGDVVANQAVTIEFQVLEGGFENIYQETQSPTTDANGIIAVTIGEGTVLIGDFTTIDWGFDEHFLNVKIDTGTGLVDLGNSLFNTVPYAIIADKLRNPVFKREGSVIIALEDSDFLIGAPTINYDNSEGTVDYKMFFIKSLNAFRVGAVNGDHWDINNVGGNSFASGYNTYSAGYSSISMGVNNTVSGDNSAAFGSGNNLVGVNSFAQGVSNFSLLDNVQLLGHDLRTGAMYQTVFGKFNEPTSTAVFQIGNGNSEANRKTLFSIENNGAISSNFYKGTGERNVVADATGKLIIGTDNANEAGLEPITENGNSGFRLANSNAANYGNIGERAVDLSTSPNPSTVRGATGDYSFATGVNTIASNSSSAAIGFENEATGAAAVSLGYRTKANALGTVAVGHYNIGGGSPNSSNGANPIFEVGNGTTEGTRSNAFTVLQNGRVGIGKHADLNGMLEIEGNSTSSNPQLSLVEDNASFARIKFTNSNRPGVGYWDIAGLIGTTQADDRLNFFNSDGGDLMSLKGDGKLGLQGGADTDLHLHHENGTAGGFKLENRNSNDWFRFYVSSTTGDLRLYSTSQGNTTSIGKFSNVSGAYTATSDRRLKKNFKDLHFNWSDFMQLEALNYQYKAQKDNEIHLGFVAQEVENIYPELVSYQQEEDVYHLNYSGFGVVAIKAVQELKKEVSALASENLKLKKQLSKYENLEARLIALEGGNNNFGNTNEIEVSAEEK